MSTRYQQLRAMLSEEARTKLDAIADDLDLRARYYFAEEDCGASETPARALRDLMAWSGPLAPYGFWEAEEKRLPGGWPAQTNGADAGALPSAQDNMEQMRRWSARSSEALADDDVEGAYRALRIAMHYAREALEAASGRRPD